MIKVNPFFLTDGYKVGHHKMYPKGTSVVYSNFTPRSNKYAPKGCDRVVSFGQQMVMRYIHEVFEENFFKQPKEEVINEIIEEYSLYLGEEYDASHMADLHDLGYLPIKVKALPEGTLVPMGVPVLTIYNTKKEFYWLTNFLETLISTLLWKPMTSATIANNFRKNIIEKYAKKSDRDNPAIDFLGHDFSMRGLDSDFAAMSSGLGHALSFLGSDSLPVIAGARYYYGATKGIIHSVNATEHSVMCAGEKDTELETFMYLMKQFPKGILSIVSDTWDLWNVLTVLLPVLKQEILDRDGKIVIRPDSGDPVDIICGSAWRVQGCTDAVREKVGEGGVVYHYVDKKYYQVFTNPATGEPYFEDAKEVTPQQKGVVELLWETFGGTINEQGYKVLDPHIGAIYGDSINDERAIAISERLMAKGFASTNVVMGIGSFTYQFNTRDTFGFAMKATYCEVETKKLTGISVDSREIFKDPVTDDGTKKSAKGLLAVFKKTGLDGYSHYYLKDQCTWTEEKEGYLKPIYQDGVFNNPVTLEEIRETLKRQ